jgi:hypothetical protein
VDNLNHGLSGAQSFDAAASRQTSSAVRSALLVGAVGRLGEALLNGLVGETAYGQVHVAMQTDIEIGVRKLNAAMPGQWPEVDDAYVVLHDPTQAFNSSTYGRQEAFVGVQAHELVKVATELAATGAKRLAIVAPLSGMIQMSGTAVALIDDDEREIHKLPFESLLILRPTPIVEPAQRNASGMQKLVGLYFSINRFMMPKSFDPIQTHNFSGVAVRAMLELSPGTTILTADRIGDLHRQFVDPR